jgi:hypothetical protein
VLVNRDVGSSLEMGMEMGIANGAFWSYHNRMKTLTMKLPEALLAWVESQAKQTKRPKSAVVREALQQRQQQQGGSALDLAGDLCGCVQSGRGDLSHNPKYLRGFGR